MHAPRPARLALIVVVVMVSSATAQAFGRFTFALILPAVVEDFGISYTFAGVLGSANLAAYLAGTVLVSVAATRVSVVRIVQVSLLASTAGLALLAVSRDLTWLWAGQILAGLAGAGIWVPSPGIAAAVAWPGRRAFTIGFVGSGIGLGLVAVSLAAVRLPADSWRTLYRAEAAIGLAATVAAAVVLPSLGVAAQRPKLDVIRTVPNWPLVLGIYVAYGLAMSLFVNFLTAMIDARDGVAVNEASAVFLFLAAASVVGGPLFGPLADRIGREVAMFIGFAAMAAAAAFALTPNLAVSSGAALVFGLAFSGVPTAYAAMISDHVDVQSFGAAFGVATLAFGLAQVFGPQVGGFAADAAGTFTPVFLGSATMALIGAALAARVWWLGVKPRRGTIPHRADRDVAADP